MQRIGSIDLHKPACDNSYHSVVGYKRMAKDFEDEANQWFANADAQLLTYQSLFKDATLAIYNEDNKAERSPISETIKQSGAHPDNPVPANMELKSMPFMHALGVLVEIRMKALILAGGSDFTWTHKLPILWGELQEEVRKEIEMHYANQIRREGIPNWISSGEIAVAIEFVGEDFIGWRYEPMPNKEAWDQFIALLHIDHVLEYAMLKYRRRHQKLPGG